MSDMLQLVVKPGNAHVASGEIPDSLHADRPLNLGNLTDKLKHDVHYSVLSFGRGVEVIANFLKVFPRFLFLGRVAK